MIKFTYQEEPIFETNFEYFRKHIKKYINNDETLAESFFEIFKRIDEKFKAIISLSADIPDQLSDKIIQREVFENLLNDSLSRQRGSIMKFLSYTPSAHDSKGLRKVFRKSFYRVKRRYHLKIGQGRFQIIVF